MSEGSQPDSETLPAIDHAAVQVERVDPLSDSRWDAWLHGLADANCFHSRAWLQVLESAYGHRAVGFVLRAGEELLGMVPVVVADSPLLGRRAACVAFADLAGPIARDAASYRRMQAAIVEYGVHEGWKTVELRGGRPWLPDTPCATQFWGHELDLTSGLERIVSSLDSATRRNTRKAEREGVRVEIADGPKSLDVYYALHCRTRRRLGSPPQPLRFFEAVWDRFILAARGFVALARFGEIPVAGVVILTHGTQATYKFGAADERYQHLRPSNAAMWAAIQHSLRLGHGTFHLGRTSRHDEGLRRYKLGWGCRETLLEYFCMDLSTRTFVARPDRAGGWPSSVMRRLPIGVMRRLGEVLYPHLL